MMEDVTLGFDYVLRWAAGMLNVVPTFGLRFLMPEMMLDNADVRYVVGANFLAWFKLRSMPNFLLGGEVLTCFSNFYLSCCYQK